MCALNLGSDDKTAAAPAQAVPLADSHVGAHAGKEEYWYAEAATWHTTWQPLGTQVFHFPSGQIEAHHQGGLKEVIFADGTATFVLPSGAEVSATKQQLSAEVQFPKPVLT